MTSSAGRRPPSRNRDLREARSVDELIGVCRGILADGHVSALECEFLQDWIARCRDLHDDPVVALLSRRLAIALRDPVAAESTGDLAAAVHAFVGGESPTASEPSRLPLDDPPPQVLFEGRSFALTGGFAFGQKTAVEAVIAECGGEVDHDVRASTSYLVMGARGSRDWAHSSYGRKVERALHFRSNGHSIAIVSEAHWQSAIDSMRTLVADE